MLKSRTDKQLERKKLRRKRMKSVIFILILLITCAIALLIWKQMEEGANKQPLSEWKKSADRKERDEGGGNSKEEGTLEGDQQNKSIEVEEETNTDEAASGSQSTEGKEERKVTLSFVGDIMLGGNVDSLLKKHGYDYPYIHVKEHLRSSDITIANLEAPITDRGEPQDKQYIYRISPKAVPALEESGIDVFNLANNHILDYGVEGLLDTFDYLDDTPIKRIGAGSNHEEAFEPVIVEKNGIQIAFLGFSRIVPEGWWKAGNNHPGVAPTYNYEMPVEAINEVRKQADLVVVITHWGVEREHTPAKYQVELAHRYIDAGADLIVASHAHVMQGFEQYKGKWIAYNLGNFIFTTNTNPNTWETIILDAECSASGSCELKANPIITKAAQPKSMDAKEGSRLLEKLARISINAIVQPDGMVTAKVKNAEQ